MWKKPKDKQQPRAEAGKAEAGAVSLVLLHSIITDTFFYTK